MRLAETLRVRERQLQRLLPVVQRRVESVLPVVRVLVDEVQQPVLGLVERAVVADLQPGVQVGVEPQPPRDVLLAELGLLEDRRVGRELDQRTVTLAVLVHTLLVLLEHALLKGRAGELALAEARHGERPGERVDRLGAHPVEAHAELEHVVVVLGPRVDARDALDDLAQRDAPAVVAHGHFQAVDRQQHLVAVAHDELVDGVVDDLLEQDVNAVVVVAAVADAADVHARAGADVFEGRERLDLALVVDGGRGSFGSHCARATTYQQATTTASVSRL